MCAKLSQVLQEIVPPGPIRDCFKSSYYKFYYNRKHFKENGFRVYYCTGKFRYEFDEGVSLMAYQDLADEMKRSLKGYLADYDLKKGDTVVDCGACFGEFAIYAAKAVGPAGRVIAFEPDQTYYRQLLENIDLNGLKNVKAVNKGVWSSGGELKFVGDDKRGYSFMSAAPVADAVTVPVACLDDELPKLGLTKIDFIKMDVEGAELEAIKGAGKTLSSNDVNLAIASYHLVDGRKSCFELEKLLSGLGYGAHTAHEGHLTTYAKRVSKKVF